MQTCLLCNKLFNSVRSLSKHLFFSHKEVTREEYYNAYICVVSPICICGNKKKFRSLQEGYRTFCSVKCRSNYVDYTGINLGRKQTPETIQARISSTNQLLKEEKRKKTMNERYGVNNPSLMPDFLEKVRKTCNNKYGVNSPTQRKESQHGKWKTVKVLERTFRVQGYEDHFLLNCKKFGYDLEDLSQGKSKCPQIEWFDDQGKKHVYFPDFFVEKDNLLIEIKSSWTFKQHEQSTRLKMKFAKEKGYNIICYVFDSRNDSCPNVIT